MAPKVIRTGRPRDTTPKPPSQPKVWKVDGIDVSPEEAAEYNITPTKAPTYQDVQRIRKFREAKKLADAWYQDIPTTPPVITSTTSTAGSGGSGSSSNGAYNSVLRNYVRNSLGNISTDLAAQEAALGSVRSGAQQRYNDYLAKLQAANATAQGNITSAGQALLATIPQQAQARPVVFQQPAAMETNVYSNYLRSLGMSAPEVANTQQYNNAQAQAANQLAQTSANAATAAQQQYLDSLRSSATMAQTAANQRLASQIPAYEMAALSTLGSTESKIDDALQKARSGAATTRQTTLDAMLPILLQYPSAAKAVLSEFGMGTPSSKKKNKSKDKNKGKK